MVFDFKLERRRSLQERDFWQKTRTDGSKTQIST
jgi:hypothetical protein